MSQPSDEPFMARALELAARGRGLVEPNPMVGAVVVSASGAAAGEGWHEYYGGPHAEVHALARAGAAARGGTLYVTLEPCCHQGKTPPCTRAVLAAGVARVVVAAPDPFPAVAGGGVRELEAAGVTVEVGLLRAEAEDLMRAYLKRLRTGTPWVIAKWAMTLDGNIATAAGDSQWISGVPARVRVQELRGRVDAILVGRGTVEADDPLLTARTPAPPPRIARRVVVTASGRLPAGARLLRTAREAPVRVYTAAGREGNLSDWVAAGAEVVGVPLAGDGLSWPAILKHLADGGATNVLVEGGGGVLAGLARADALDEAWVFLAPKLLGGAGRPPFAGPTPATLAQAPAWRTRSVEAVGSDVLMVAERVRPAQSNPLPPIHDPPGGRPVVPNTAPGRPVDGARRGSDGHRVRDR